MSERRRALGRGLGALIPSGPSGSGSSDRPVDVFFRDRENATASSPTEPAGHSGDASAAIAASPETPPTATASLAAGPDTISSADESTPMSASEALLAELEDHAGTSDGQPAGPGPTQQAGRPEAASVADPAGQDHRDGDGDEADHDGLRPVPGATFAELPLTAIHPNASQPRQVFDDDDLNELASSIREVGVLQPVVVRPAGNDADGQPAYELIMGERRWRASRVAGNTMVPAIIRDSAQQDMLRDALLENLHRAQLNPLEEAAAYQQLLDDFGCTHDELALRIARSRPQISNTLRLLKLPPLVQRRVAAGVLSAGHARALLGLGDGAAMERLAQRIVAEGLSVRATEEIVTLGEDPVQPELRRRPRAGAHSTALNELAGRLSDDLDTKVKVNLGQRKGHVTIEFASVQDLNRILGVLVPSDPGILRDQQSEDSGSKDQHDVDA